MRNALLILLGVLAIAWVWSFATKTGINLFWPDDSYMQSDAYGYEFDPTTGATEDIAGRRCWYLTYSGTRQVILVDRGYWQELQDAMRTGERPVDPVLRTSVVVDDWYTARCPVTLRFVA